MTGRQDANLRGSTEAGASGALKEEVGGASHALRGGALETHAKDYEDTDLLFSQTSNFRRFKRGGTGGGLLSSALFVALILMSSTALSFMLSLFRLNYALEPVLDRLAEVEGMHYDQAVLMRLLTASLENPALLASTASQRDAFTQTEGMKNENKATQTTEEEFNEEEALE
ncbi:hypothetical protein Emag_006885 [Eimeria magna]